MGSSITDVKTKFFARPSDRKELGKDINKIPKSKKMKQRKRKDNKGGIFRINISRMKKQRI
ncbi:hypothetical protein YDYSY3_38120 [Paenibacillus chitinolyticus]|nr:hypothetical protein YDYSY3_38120 [Paenibacillus chitinolyticus]